MASHLGFQQEWSTFTTTGFDTQEPAASPPNSVLQINFDSPTLKKGAGGIPRNTPVIFRNFP